MIRTDKPNIILIGFMGCGKSTVGKRLSFLLGFNFVDMDDYIVRSEGMSIAEIFESHGEKYFRELEYYATKKLSQQKAVVISTGGGIIKNARNMELLKQKGKVFYIRASVQKIYRNTKEGSSRPLLNTPDRLSTIHELLAERTPLYEKYADHIIDSDGRNVSGIVREIMGKYQN